MSCDRYPLLQRRSHRLSCPPLRCSPALKHAAKASPGAAYKLLSLPRNHETSVRAAASLWPQVVGDSLSSQSCSSIPRGPAKRSSSISPCVMVAPHVDDFLSCRSCIHSSHKTMPVLFTPLSLLLAVLAVLVFSNPPAVQRALTRTCVHTSRCVSTPTFFACTGSLASNFPGLSFPPHRGPTLSSAYLYYPSCARSPTSSSSNHPVRSPALARSTPRYALRPLVHSFA